MTNRQMRAFGLAVVAMFAGAACSDDDDGDDAADTTVEVSTVTPTTDATTTVATTDSAPSTSSATGDDTSGGTDEFCTTVVEAEQIAAAGPDVDFEAATEEDIAAAMEEFSAALVPLLDQLSATVPEEISGDIETIDAALRDAIETGEDPASAPGFVEADRSIDQYVAENCGFEVYPVRAVEYAFEDVPDTIESGIVGFDLQNEGEELHEMVLFRIADDVDLTVEELLELPEEEAEQSVEFIGAGFALPGENDMAFFDLRPGRYGMVCFVPVGTTDMSILEGGGSATSEATSGDATTDDAMTGEATTGEATTGEATGSATAGPELGPPHFTQGMVTEFEVVEAGSGGSGSTTTTEATGSSGPSTTDGSGGSTPSTSSTPDTTERSTASSAPSTTAG